MKIVKVEPPYVYEDNGIKHKVEQFINEPVVGAEVAMCGKGKLFAIKESRPTLYKAVKEEVSK